MTEGDNSPDEFDPGDFVRQGGYEDVVDRIQSGDADSHLSEVRDAEVSYRDRTSVNNALDERGAGNGEST